MNTKNLKPFNLQAALKGEPVMLRDGSKAFIRHHETEFPVGDDFRLFGILCVGLNAYTTTSWTTQGKWRDDGRDYEHDIIGMWPKTRTINGFEVPMPETEEPEGGACFFMADVFADGYYGDYKWSERSVLSSFHTRALSRGLVFLNKEDAIANAKAMLGIDPYEECEE